MEKSTTSNGEKDSFLKNGIGTFGAMPPLAGEGIIFYNKKKDKMNTEKVIRVMEELKDSNYALVSTMLKSNKIQQERADADNLPELLFKLNASIQELIKTIEQSKFK